MMSHEADAAPPVNLASDFLAYIRDLARVEDLKVGAVSKPEGSAVRVLSGMEIYLPLAGLVDAKRERARIGREIVSLGAEIDAFGRRLKDDNFLTKAPKEVIEKQRERMAQLEAQRAKLRENLNDLR